MSTEVEACSGYLHPSYAASLAEFGVPKLLPQSGGWILEREVAGTPLRDAMGCYPLFACRDWRALPDDLETIAGENSEDGPVSLALVTDPFGNFDAGILRRCFGDRVIPFKEHFVVSLDGAAEDGVSDHHRYYAQRARASVEVEKCEDTTAFLDEWVELYRSLTVRHALKGVKAFSATAFAQQLKVPGIVVLRARCEGRTVGAHLWYVQGDTAYSHLAAADERGYELMASYALYSFALEYFRDRVQWLDLGAGAGLDAGSLDGLTRFKRGWTSRTRTAYFCGRIFDHEKYRALTAARKIQSSDYFPAYRAGEFG
jgi:Acetyltransferase (GNAT) domain